MRTMKTSGVDWIGSIPDHWQVIRTKNAFQNHKDVAGDAADEYERLALTLSGVIKRSKEDSTGLQPEAFNSYQILRQGELVFKLIDLANVQTSRVGLSPYTGLVSPAYIILSPKSNICAEYAQYYFLSMWQREIFNHMGDDGVRSSLNAHDLLEIPLTLPPLDEQRMIADFLDKECREIKSIIISTQRTINEYKKLKQTIITGAVTKGIRNGREMRRVELSAFDSIPLEWRHSPIKHVAVFQPQCNTSALTEDTEITYTPMEFIKNGYYIPNTAKFGAVASSLTPYEDGDIVMAKVTPCFENGNIAIMENLASGFGMGSSELFVYRATRVNKRFLMYWLQNDKFKDEGCATMTGTGGLKRVSPYYAKNAVILLPPDDEQTEIVAFLDEKCSEVDRLISAKERLLAEMESYKKSVIYEYVTGKKEVPACQ